MNDQWDVYMCRVDDQPASIFLDMGIANNAPLEGFTSMVFLRVFMNQARPDGLSSREEFETLNEIEDQIEKELGCQEPMVYVGRCTNNSVRDFYFYATNAEDLSERLKAVLSFFPDYKYEVDMHNDPEWKSYWDFLYPSETDMQIMGDHAVIEQLESRGDRLDQPREIMHWAYFPNILARQAFEAKAKGLGFSVINYIEPDVENSNFGITITRIDLPSHNEISEVTLSLFHLAKQYEGTYDGWETQVII